MVRNFFPTQGDKDIAKAGLTFQAKVHNLDLTNPDIQAFLNKQADVIAAYEAQCKWLRAHIDQMSLYVKLHTSQII